MRRISSPSPPALRFAHRNSILKQFFHSAETTQIQSHISHILIALVNSSKFNYIMHYFFRFFFNNNKGRQKWWQKEIGRFFITLLAHYTTVSLSISDLWENVKTASSHSISVDIAYKMNHLQIEMTPLKPDVPWRRIEKEIKSKTLTHQSNKMLRAFIQIM